MNKKIKALQDEIIGLKQHIEQLDLARDKAELYIEDIYPAINSVEIRQGWRDNCGIGTYKVVIDVHAEDLIKLMRFLTNKKLRDKKWSMINSEIQERIRSEIKEEYDISD